MKRLIIYIICSAGLALSGCASKEQTRKYVKQGTASVNQVTRALYGSARSHPGANQEVLDEYERDFEIFRSQQRSEFAKLKKEIEEEKLQREALVSALASLAIELLPAGAPALKVAKALGIKIDDAAGKALLAANEKTEEVRMTANNNKEEIGALTGATEGIAKDTGNIEDKLDKMEMEIGVLKEGKIAIDKDFALAQVTLKSLDAVAQEKLGNVQQSVLAELERLKDDGAAFRVLLKESAQLTNEEMKALQGMSTGELITLLAAASAAAGTGGLLGKTGRSRGAGKMDDLTIELAKVEARLDARRVREQPESRGESPSA